MWHLDTNIVVAYLRGDRTVADHVRSVVPDVAINAIVLAELLYGVRLSARPAENLHHLQRFLELVQVVPFDEACAEAYGRIRFELRQKGRTSSEIDNLIAAVSLAKGATLVTRNVGHFQAIEGLRIEDWKE